MTRRKWTPQTIAKEASKYETRQEFFKGCKAAHAAAQRRGIMDDVCKHMRNGYEKWTVFEIEQEAKKYQRLRDFELKSPAAYTAARRRGIMDDVCKHMVQNYTRWCHASLKAEASNFSTRSDFAEQMPGAYVTARKRGILDDICGHMERGRGDFDSLYVELIIDADRHAKIPFDHSLIKIGVTSSRLKDTRQVGWAKRNDMTRQTLVQITTEDARTLETNLLNQLETPEMKSHVIDGRTEFRIIEDGQIKEFVKNVSFHSAVGK